MLSFLKSHKSVMISPVSMLVFLGLLIGGVFIFLIREILIMVFLAFLLMTALNPGVKKLEKKYKVPKPLAILLMYILMISVIVITLVLIIPPLTDQLPVLLKYFNLPSIQEELRNFNLTLENLQTVFDGLGASVNTIINLASSAFNGVFTFFTILILSYYFLVDRERLHLRLWWISNNHKQLKLAKQILDDIEFQLGGWVRGQLILMVLIGVITYVVLLILGVPYALPLALLAGLFEILPNLGPIIAGILGTAFMGFHQLGNGLTVEGVIWTVATAFLYWIIQWLENSIIVPRIMKANADVSPIATIITILIGLKIAGVFGALLAVPVYIVLRIFHHYWMKSAHKPV